MRGARSLRRALLAAVPCLFAACGCPGYAVDDQGFLADYADYVQAPERLRASVVSPRSIAPAALFVTAGLLQIDNADGRLQDDLVVDGASTWPADTGQALLVATAFVLPFLAPPRDLDAKPWTVAVTNLEAWAWTVGITQGVKAFDLRDRPNGGSGGFFSGHTSASFSAATVLEREYGPAVGVPAYVLASFVGYDRIRTDDHYPADVLVGAGVAILVSNLIYDKDLGKEGYFRRRYRIEAGPVVDEHTMGFTVGIRW